MAGSSVVTCSPSCSDRQSRQEVALLGSIERHRRVRDQADALLTIGCGSWLCSISGKRGYEALRCNAEVW